MSIEQASTGTFSCPVCGKETPHHRSPAEIADYNETERWIDASWEMDREKFFPGSSEIFKPA